MKLLEAYEALKNVYINMVNDAISNTEDNDDDTSNEDNKTPQIEEK